nr:hypothetical protein [Acaryochloris thomasi]
MKLIQKARRLWLPLVLSSLLFVTAGCSSAPPAPSSSALTGPSALSTGYIQLEQGNTRAGQDFGAWVTQTAKGIVKDAYVRDEDKLGVVITPQVDPKEVKSLAKSLVAGFQKNFPNRDLKVLVYAPDKELILTANYDRLSNRIQYQAS